MMMQNIFREIAQEAVKQRICNRVTGCGKVVHDSEFTDKVSLDEYYIAGLCQGCQDRIYASLEQDEC